jgi:hypothetical protein
MTTFTLYSGKSLHKASEHFLKMFNDLDLDKYKLDRYQELFKLASFRNMHDADLAYHDVYAKCAKNADTRQSLLNCLDQEKKLLLKHPKAFDSDIYRLHVHKAINDISRQLDGGALDHLYL